MTDEPDTLSLVLEADRRGILPNDKKELLAEARRRGLVPSATLPQEESDRALRRGANKFSLGLLNYPMDAWAALVHSQRADSPGFGAEYRNQRALTRQAISSDNRSTLGMAGDMAVDTAAYTGQAVASAPLMVARTAGELAQGGIQATRAAYARLFDRGAMPAAAELQAAQVPGNVLTRLQIGRESGRVGAAFGMGEGYGNAPDSYSTADVLTRMGEHAAGGYALGRAIPATINFVGDYVTGPIRNALTQRARAGAERANVVARDFEEAGIPIFPPALGGAMVQGTATGLEGTVVGSSLRRGASHSIDTLGERIAQEMGTAGGVRTTTEAGEEAQRLLRRNLLERSTEREVIEAMPPQQLQDLSNVGPGPDARVPPPPRRPRIAPEPVEPVTADRYLEELRASVPEVPPRRVEPVPPEYRPVENVAPPNELIGQERELLAHMQTIEQQYGQLMAERDKLLTQLQPYVEPNASLSGLRVRPDPEGRTLYAQMQRLDQQMTELAQQHAAYKQRHDGLLKQWDELRPNLIQQRQAQVDSEAGLLAALRNTALEDAARREAASETRRMQSEVVERARPTAEMEAAARTQQLRDEVQRQADEATRLNQQRSDDAYRADLESRQARAREPITELPASSETYPTQFDAAYEGVRRNAPPIQRNLLGSRNEPPTNLAQELEAIAVEARGRGQQEGYREGRLFGEDGKTLRPELLEYLRPRVGNEVTDAIAYMARHRASGQFTPGLQGKQDIRTTIGRAIREADETGHDASLLKRIYRAVDNDIEAFTGVTPAGQFYRQQRTDIDALHESFVNDIRDPLRKVFNQDNPARAMELLERTTQAGGNINELRAFFRVVRDKGDQLQAVNAVLSQKLQRDGLQGFIEFYRGLTPEARSIMFQGNASAYGSSLDRLTRVGGHLERYMKNAAPGYATDLSRIFNTGNVAGALLYHLNIPLLIKSAVTGEVASRILSSQWFGKWLRAVPVEKGPRSVEWQRHMNRLRDLASSNLGLDQATSQALLASVMSVASAGPAPRPEKRQRNDATLWEPEGPMYQGRYGYWGNNDGGEIYDDAIVHDPTTRRDRGGDNIPDAPLNPEGGRMRYWAPFEMGIWSDDPPRMRGPHGFRFREHERIDVPFPEVESNSRALSRRRGSSRFIRP
ncbi:MAG: hypothetical protein K2X43_01310 [Hyphomonadaceae bacterium]|nr:hypothetical protein [Hyphomonadaceae bacterium]